MRKTVVGVLLVAALMVFAFAGVIWLTDAPWFDSLALSREVRESTSCEPDPTHPTAQNVDARASRTAAWILGVRQGEHHGWLKQLRQGERVRDAEGMNEWLVHAKQKARDTEAAVDRMATLLKVPTAPLAVPASASEEIDAFRTFLEAQSQPTARALARTYSTEVCKLYKLGGYWGYSILFRAAAPSDRNIFAPEIRYYSAELAIPNALVGAMTEPLSSTSDADVQAASEKLSQAIAEHWSRR